MPIILAILLILLSAPVHTASAGEIEQCGTPVPTELSAETSGFCDIYTRQLAYRLEANEMRRLIHARQENFQAPAVAARARYEKEIKKLNEKRGQSKPEA